MKYLIIILLTALLSCHSINQGTVTEKYVQPGYVEVTYIKTSNALIPVSRYIPPRYHVVIAGENKTDDYTVKKSDWDTVRVGSFIKFK